MSIETMKVEGPLHVVCQCDKCKAEKQKQGEPVAWTLTETLEKKETTTTGRLWFSNPQNSSWTPLYTTPQPAQKPLTDEQIDEATQKWAGHTMVSLDRLIMCREYARAIEAAHGIKENT